MFKKITCLCDKCCTILVHLQSLFIMYRIYDIKTFEDEILQCYKCHWAGLGKEAMLEPQMLTAEIEIYCPQCEAYIGLASSLEDNATSS